MYQKDFYVLKESGTYSNVLEAIGLAEVIGKITKNQESVRIRDRLTHFQVIVDDAITEDMVNNTNYFDGFTFVKFKEDTPVPEGISFIDYKKEKSINKNQKKKEKEIYLKISKTADKKQKHLLFKIIEEYSPKKRSDWDILSNINKLKVSTAYEKLFNNVFKNKTIKDENIFPAFLKAVLTLYSILDDNTFETKKALKHSGGKFDEVKSLQMLNPHQVKGVNKEKATGISMGAEDVLWIREYLKIIGCFKAMFVRPIQVSNKTWDTKIYVLSPKEIDYSRLTLLHNSFKPNLRGVTSLKMDISSILLFCKTFIENIEEYKTERPFLRSYQPNHFVSGFSTAYLKKLGTSESVSNISFLQLPDFIKVKNRTDGDNWIKILEEHRKIFSRDAVKEAGQGLYILQSYRSFISSGSIDKFLESLSSYSELLIQEISKEHYYVYPFSQTLLEQFFKLTEDYYMKTLNTPLSPIFQNEGFKNIAKAIRSSTISLQYTPKNQRVYEVKYGMAQDLKRKSAYRNELVEYIMEFTAFFNAENARIKERKGDNAKTRSNIKQQDIEEFISLVDEYDASLIGKLLCAYGYALDRKEKINEKEVESLETEGQEDSEEESN
ncbi:MAG: hypothetical protein M0Q21_07785 [Ignavibacteriaceae bacterium]|nr:hypothetical protein [Ignavibacteriaceae bacterium]